jgi:hypothetical protein
MDADTILRIKPALTVLLSPRRVACGDPATRPERGQFYFAETGHYHFAATEGGERHGMQPSFAKASTFAHGAFTAALWALADKSADKSEGKRRGTRSATADLRCAPTRQVHPHPPLCPACGRQASRDRERGGWAVERHNARWVRRPTALFFEQPLTANALAGPAFAEAMADRSGYGGSPLRFAKAAGEPGERVDHVRHER